MKCYSKYVFIRNPLSVTSFLLQAHYGATIDNFLSYYKDTPQNRKKNIANKAYVTFRNPVIDKQRAKFDKILSNSNGVGRSKIITITGFKFDGKQSAIGDNFRLGTGDAIKATIQEDDENEVSPMLTVCFYRNLALARGKMIEMFNKNELSEEVDDTDILFNA